MSWSGECGNGRPSWSKREAERRAAREVRFGNAAAGAIRCPYGGDPHWHVTTGPDDPLVKAAEAFAEQRRLSVAMAEAQRHRPGS